MKFIKYIVIISFAFVLVAINFYCNNSDRKSKINAVNSKYLNHNDTVKYVGINTCKHCHGNIYETFIKTGMGKSFDVATHQKSSATFGKDAIVYDKYRNFYYKSFWRGDSLYINEYRLSGKDTIYKRIEKVNFIIGSGQHTNSHLCNRNGYLTQMPMTFYTQKKEWHLPPGFEDGANTRFSRNIGLECMSCHNSYPDFAMGSENKFDALPNGIGCERCHGPGEAHVAQKKNGDIVDTSKYIDYSIVNPAKLSVELQFDVCQRCHLQGDAVLKNDHSFYDFKPGYKLSDYISVFLPKYTNADDEFIMASHADRLKQSKCFIKTFDAAKNSKELRPYKNGLTCVSCHNPHVSVRETNKNIFNDACKKCHTSNDEKNCDLSVEIRNKKNENNCVSCHMPKSGAIDIPHVTVHDHWIHVPIETKKINAIIKFIGLVAINEKNPDHITKAAAYINYYEKFSKQEMYLDSAANYLNINNSDGVKNNLFIYTKFYFLKSNYGAIKNLISSIGETQLLQKILVKKSFENKHAWAAYYIADASLALADTKNALLFFEKAVTLAPHYSEFKNKLGALYNATNNNEKAQQMFQEIVNENPNYVPAINNLGYMYLLQSNFKMGEFYINKALSLDPDYEQALENKAKLQIQKGENLMAKKTIAQLLKINAKNTTAIALQKIINAK